MVDGVHLQGQVSNASGFVGRVDFDEVAGEALGTRDVTQRALSDTLRISVGGTDLDLLTMTETIQVVRGRLAGSSQLPPLAIVSVNLDHLTYFGSLGSHSSQIFCRNESRLIWLFLADGWPIRAWARNRTGRPWPLLPGSDLLPSLLRLMNEEGLRLGILGGTAETHSAFQQVMELQYPAIVTAGYWNPTRAEVLDLEASRRVSREISDAQVDVLLVGLGKPRQEEWLAAYGTHTNAKVLLAFGAAADFVAGTKRRAPVVVRTLRLEWLYRLIQEPRRLARRYIFQAPRALWMLVSSHPYLANVLRNPQLRRFLGV